MEKGIEVAVGTLRPLRYCPLDVTDAIKVRRCRILQVGLTAIQRVVDDISAWCQLRHNNILPVLGLVTKFDYAISLVSLWMANGNAHDYVRNNDVSPIRLVRSSLESLVSIGVHTTQLIGVASGLCYLHAHNPHPIYHGNLRGVCISMLFILW